MESILGLLKSLKIWVLDGILVSLEIRQGWSRAQECCGLSVSACGQNRCRLPHHPNFHNLDHLHKDRPLPSLFREGDSGEQLTGDRREQLTGDRGEQLTGDRGEQLTGDRGEQLTGDRGEQLTGDREEWLKGEKGRTVRKRQESMQ